MQIRHIHRKHPRLTISMAERPIAPLNSPVTLGIMQAMAKIEAV
jgi:hypothetical protein